MNKGAGCPTGRDGKARPELRRPREAADRYMMGQGLFDLDLPRLVQA